MGIISPLTDEGGGAAGDEVSRSEETQADWLMLVCVLGLGLERVLSTAFAAVCYLTIEDWKKEKRGRRSLRDRKRFRFWKETSTVTF